MRVAQINMVHFGSTGKIMFHIAKLAAEQGMQVRTFSTYAASKRPQPLPPAPDGHWYYGSHLGNTLSSLLSHITGGYGFHSRCSTNILVRKLKAFRPDVIHLHNLHAGYLHLPTLFRYAQKNNIRLIWTLHDCWTFTGKCPHFSMAKCDKWKTGCHHCAHLQEYPHTYLDTTSRIWRKKKKLFANAKNLTLVTPSQWLADLTRESFLKDCPVEVIHNGIDLSVFQPTESEFREKYGCQDKFILLGVAFGWGIKKGLDVFLELAKNLSDDYQIVLVGTDPRIDAQLPENIISIHRTKDQRELAQIYSAANLFINPTREDTYPTVNMESLACGTPVLTFRTGGSPEILDESCGYTVACDDVQELVNQIHRIKTTAPYSRSACIKRSQDFNMYDRFREYLRLYDAQSR